MKKRILLLAVALLMICSLSLTAYATHPVPDLSSNGSITLQMAPGGVALKDGNLNLYKVGELTERTAITSSPCWMAVRSPKMRRSRWFWQRNC